MRIGIDVQTLETHERTRGIGKLCAASIDALMQYAPDHEYVLFGFGARVPEAANVAVERGARYYEIKTNKPREELLADHAASEFLWTTPAARSLDVYIVTSPFMFDIVLPQYGPCPIAAVLLDAIPALMYERGQPVYDAVTWAKYQQRAEVIRTYRAYLAISQSAADDCARLLDLRTKNITVTYVPIEQRPLAHMDEGSASNILKRYALKPGYVLSISGYNFRKNIRGTLAAYAELPARTREAHPLVIVCGLEPQERSDVENQISRLRITGQVILTGYVPDEHLPVLLSSAGALLFVSLYEGFGLPVAEAMAAGTAVVVANNSSLPEVVGSAGDLCDAADFKVLALRIEKMLNDETLRKQRIAAGFLQVQKFSPRNYAKRVIDALQTISIVPAEVAKRPDVTRIAIFSAPDDYTAQLIRHLPAEAEVHWFGDFAQGMRAVNVLRLPYDAFLAMHERFCYDAIVFQWSECRNCGFMLPFMAMYGGIVVLHQAAAAGEGCANADAVIIHSERAARAVRAITDVPVERIYMGAGFNYVIASRTPREQFRAAFGLAQEGFAIALRIAGARAPDVEEVLEAFREFRLSHAFGYLVVAGHHERNRLKQITGFCRRFSLMHCLRFAGEHEPAEEYNLLSAVDAVIDLGADATPSTMAALAMGKPLMVRDGSDAAEFPDSVCWKFGGGDARRELAEYLCTLNDDEAARAQLGENAQAYARGAAWHLVASQFLQAIRTIKAETGTREAVAL